MENRAKSRATDYPVLRLKEVEAQENEAIKQARQRTPGSAYFGKDLPVTDESKIGLALSGGGIRSATFSLGVLQALANKEKLVHIDYLSTVSGGGYIGSWLTAWIHRKGLAHVCSALKSNGVVAGSANEAPEVAWLRQYSNYLAPNLGLLSADSMTLVAIWCRNVLLNMVILFSFLALWFLVPRLLLVPVIFSMQHLSTEMGLAALWLGFFLFPLGLSYCLTYATFPAERGEVILLSASWQVLILVITPGILTAILASIALFSRETSGVALTQAVISGTIILTLSGTAWFFFQVAMQRPWRVAKETGIFLLAFVVAMIVGFGMLLVFTELIRPIAQSHTERAANLLTFGPPALLLTFGVAGTVLVGIVGRAYLESSREWWSRMNAWFAMLGFVWLGICALSFYAVPVMLWVHGKIGAWTTAVLGTTWLTGLLATLFSKEGAAEGRSVRDIAIAKVLGVAVVIVVTGIFFGVAAGVGSTVETAFLTQAENDNIEAAQKKATPPAALGFNDEGILPRLIVESFARQELSFRACRALPWLSTAPSKAPAAAVCPEGLSGTGLLTLATLLTFLVFGWRVDVNKFSLHNLYKNRLIRCYLGASNDKRNPHPFTGFADKDDIKLSNMQAENQEKSRPVRPLHILNSALNITQGSNLAWQERKAASFTFTPFHCGFLLGSSTGDADKATGLSAGKSSVGGYRDAKNWASKHDEGGAFTLGMAMATSGAAVSANQGRASSPALAFILTIFNVRLGRWSPNPLWRNGWRNASPSFGLFNLLQELFGHSTEVSDYLYLSDGGHFDNTGIYELVRRRCGTIIAVDAAQDEERDMSDLANLVRKCRIDFGVDITVDLNELGTSRAQQRVSAGFVVGKIKYDIEDSRKDGTLIIIKPTLVSKLDTDVFGFSRESKSFPQQSTIDQFFSESQFESYRKLGERIAEAATRHPKFPFN